MERCLAKQADSCEIERHSNDSFRVSSSSERDEADRVKDKLNVEALDEEIAAAEARCWQAIEDAMKQLEEDRAAICKRQGRHLNELQVSPIRSSMEESTTSHAPEKKARNRKKKKRLKARKERRRSIDMKVPDLFEDDDEGIFLGM